MARTSFIMARFLPIMLVGLLVIANILVQGMGLMGKGFKTPENEIWSGPVLPEKLLLLPDLAGAKVIGSGNAPLPSDKPHDLPPPVVKPDSLPVKTPSPTPPPSPPSLPSLPLSPPSTPLSPSPPLPAAATEGKFVVQVGSFALNMGVDSLIEQLKKGGMTPHVETVQDRVNLNNVQVGPFVKLELAKEAEAKLKAGGIQAQVEENWEGYLISLGKFMLLGHAVEEMERVKALGVAPLRVVKVGTDLAVRKILLGPFDTKEKALKMSAQVAGLGFSVPVLKTWPLSNTLP
ncbi:putative SPOR domain-containing protein [uncultured Gammaproteobacteria bacterium]